MPAFPLGIRTVNEDKILARRAPLSAAFQLAFRNSAISRSLCAALTLSRTEGEIIYASATSRVRGFSIARTLRVV